MNSSYKIVTAFLPLVTFATSENESETYKPNLIVIMTDEHNLRTLQCYRDLMDDEQAYQSW